ncbi:MAG: histidine kinase, partial [Eubacteriales bacterium]|nr:histidine kinase [Eubacteriales bacterium]
TTKSLAGNTLDSYIWLDSFHSPFESYGEQDINTMVNHELIDNLLYDYDVLEQDGGYLFLHTLSGSKWLFGAYMSNKTLLYTYGGTIIITISLFFALIIIVTFLSLPIINRSTNPLRELTASMRKVAAGDLTVVTEVQSNDEIGELSYVFCYMVRELNVHIDKLIEKEKIEQRMRYSLLISEIDPHFIYNTMNTINYLARKGRDEDIIEINTALIKILQDRLRIGRIEVFDSMSQEIDMLRQYMIVQQFRYSNVEIDWDIAPELWDEQIPKNILQPLVENALKHGLTNDEGESINGHIGIKVRKQDDSLIIEVMDNGRGMSEEKIEELNTLKLESSPEERGRHIGINNIRKRLAYIYGNESCIGISRREQGGTCVTLTLHQKQSRYNK